MSMRGFSNVNENKHLFPYRDESSRQIDQGDHGNYTHGCGVPEGRTSEGVCCVRKLLLLPLDYLHVVRESFVGSSRKRTSVLASDASFACNSARDCHGLNFSSSKTPRS